MVIKMFPPAASEEYRRHLEKAMRLFDSCGPDISSYSVPPDVKIERLSSTKVLKPGETVTAFEVDRPGRIVGIRMGPADAFAGKGRDIVLRAFWDGEKEPAILSPAGDFFGYAWGEPAMKSLLIGTADGTNYCYYAMPFDKSARIEMVSQQDSDTKQATIQTEVMFAPIGRRNNEGKFYAIWRRENPTTKGEPFTFIRTDGRGHIVGCIQQSQGFESGNTYFFEGDDQTTIDGKLTIHGTGSEGFFNGGGDEVAGGGGGGGAVPPRRGFVF